jgi:hypothetical protein
LGNWTLFCTEVVGIVLLEIDVAKTNIVYATDGDGNAIYTVNNPDSTKVWFGQVDITHMGTAEAQDHGDDLKYYLKFGLVITHLCFLVLYVYAIDIQAQINTWKSYHSDVSAKHKISKVTGKLMDKLLAYLKSNDKNKGGNNGNGRNNNNNAIVPIRSIGSSMST